MFDNNSAYTLLAETVDGITKYYVSFFDGQGEKQEVEVSHPIYEEFLKFVKIERNLKRWSERHVEYSNLTCESIFKRALSTPKSIEDVVSNKIIIERLEQALESLTETQRRRFEMFYKFDLSYEQIAELEGCSRVATFKSINRAKLIIEQIVNF